VGAPYRTNDLPNPGAVWLPLVRDESRAGPGIPEWPGSREEPSAAGGPVRVGGPEALRAGGKCFVMSHPANHRVMGGSAVMSAGSR